MTEIDEQHFVAYMRTVMRRARRRRAEGQVLAAFGGVMMALAIGLGFWSSVVFLVGLGLVVGFRGGRY